MTLKDKTQYDFGGYCSNCLNKLKECTCKSIDFKMDIKKTKQMKIDDKIKRFCKVVNQINMAHNFLDSERDKFYDGGHSFEKVYSENIKDIKEKEDEFKLLLFELTS